MGVEAGRLGGQRGIVQQPFGMAALQRQCLAAKALPGALVQTDQSGVEPSFRTPFVTMALLQSN